jgi:hypothetical protein
MGKGGKHPDRTLGLLTTSSQTTHASASEAITLQTASLPRTRIDIRPACAGRSGSGRRAASKLELSLPGACERADRDACSRQKEEWATRRGGLSSLIRIGNHPANVTLLLEGKSHCSCLLPAVRPLGDVSDLARLSHGSDGLSHLRAGRLAERLPEGVRATTFPRSVPVECRYPVPSPCRTGVIRVSSYICRLRRLTDVRQPISLM